jgi:hypothetical protein
MFKTKAKELKRLRKFGEICIAATNAKIQGKLNDREPVCVLLVTQIPMQSTSVELEDKPYHEV